MSNEPLAPIPPPNGPWPTPAPQPKLESTPEQRATGIVTCPYCEHKFPLTWGIYLSHGFTFGRICPKCKEKAAAVWLEPYIIWLIVLAASALLVGLILSERNFNGNSSILILMAEFVYACGALLLVIIPIDRYLQARFIPLKKQNSEKGTDPAKDSHQFP